MAANGLSNDKEPKNVANDVMQLAKSVKTNVNKVAFSRILPRKDKFNSKAKEVNTHLQDIFLQITFLQSPTAILTHTVTLRVYT